VGVFTVAAAHKAGPKASVVAIEPDPFLASLIQRTAMHDGNRDLSISVLCAAVSDRCGIAHLAVATRGRSSNSLVESGSYTQSGGTRYVQHVPTLTLDAMLNEFEAPSFVKIDVEGAESLVMAGAEKLLADHRPTIYIEVGKEQCTQVTSVFNRHQYRLYDGDTTDERPVDACVWNTLAVPAESRLTNRGV